MAFLRQSKRRTALFLETLWQQPCYPALTIKLQTQVTVALRPPYDELAAALPAQPHLGIDESPTQEAATQSWLWTFVAGVFTLVAWRGTRAATVLTELLTARCFSANLDAQCFHCFKCGRSGNALDLWAQATGQTPYDAALDLCQRLGIPLPTLPPPARHREEEPVVLPAESCTMNAP